MRTGSISFRSLAPSIALAISAISPPAQAQEGAVSFSKGAQPREVVVTVKNGANACGMQVQFSDARIEKKRIEAGETWTVSHTATADGNLPISVEGVLVARGLRTVGPCGYRDSALLSVAGGNATLQTASGSAGSAPQATRSGAGGSGAAAAAPAAAQARGPEQDMIVLLRKERQTMKFTSTLDGGRKLANGDEVARRGVTVCVLKYPNAYSGLSDETVQAAALSELGRYLAQATGGRTVPTPAQDCIANEGTADARFSARTEVVMVQRAAYPVIANSSPEFAQGFEPLYEVPQATLFAAAERQRDAAARQQQALTDRAAELERLAQANSLEKVGSLAFSVPRDSDNVAFCTLSYDGEKGSAILGYAYRGFATQSDAFRSQAERVKAKIDANRPFAKGYPSLEALYEARQTKASECMVYVDFPANLKRIMEALQRDRKPFVLNELVSAAELRDGWAARAGYTDYAEYGAAREMKVNAQQLKALAGFQVRDKAGLDAVIREMQASRYSTSDSASEALGYLKDKAEAAGKPGTTALTVRTARERAAQEAATAQAAAEQRRRQEYARDYPYIAVLTCGMPGHINILACFAGGRNSVDTELKLTNGSSVNLYKVYNLREAGQERQDGFYIDLRSTFNLRAQNADDTLVLGLKIIDRVSNRVLIEDKAARFGVVSARN